MHYRNFAIIIFSTLCVTVSALSQENLPTNISLRVSDQLVINHFEFNPDQLETHLVITDVEGAGPIVNVLVYDENGSLIDKDFFFLPTFGKINYNPADSLRGKKFIGTLRIISDGGRVAAQYWQFYKNPELSYYDTTLPASDGNGAYALLCQHFVSDKDIDSFIYLSNAQSDSDAVVAVTFYLDRGKQLSKDKYTIPPNGKISINPYIANEGIQKTGVAVAESLNEVRITGEYWQASKREKYQVSLPLEQIAKRKREW